MVGQLVGKHAWEYAPDRVRHATALRIAVHTGTKTDKIDKSKSGLRLTLSGENAKDFETDVVLVAIGVSGYVEGLAAPQAKLPTARPKTWR